jgi:DNA excision repair protein ERCC-2
VPEIEKALAELQRLMDYRTQVLGKKEAFLGIGLSSRKNLCLHPTVSQERRGERVDAGCQALTASWVRASKATTTTTTTTQKTKTKRKREPTNNKEPTDAIGDIEDGLCSFFETLERAGSSASMPAGVYTLDDLRSYGSEKGYCPYFLARRLLPLANVIIYSYHYLLDPKVADMVSREMMAQDSIVVFDEAHNIDNVCTESLSMDISRPMLDAGSRSLSLLTTRIQEYGFYCYSCPVHFAHDADTKQTQGKQFGETPGRVCPPRSRPSR